jgi:membrane dipeptidase
MDPGSSPGNEVFSLLELIDPGPTPMTVSRPLVIDGCQYANWSQKIFGELKQGGMSCVVVTIVYHESLREALANVGVWNQRFARYPDILMPGRTADDVRRAHAEGKTAIVFGFQNCSPIEEDLDLVEIWHQLGVRFMQLSYNNQSLLATGCYETEDPGITRMGRQVIREMNRVGMVIDMSHSAERSTLEAIEISERPIAITHANPASWMPALRNKSDTVLKALAESGGMLGFSLYPHHLKDKSACTLESFCDMIARTADLMGVERIGIGSDLCQDQPDSVVEWMRVGRWTRDIDYGEGSRSNAGFPPQPRWFENNLGFTNIADGLRNIGFSEGETDSILGQNWLSFFETSFGPRAG